MSNVKCQAGDVDLKLLSHPWWSGMAHPHPIHTCRAAWADLQVGFRLKSPPILAFHHTNLGSFDTCSSQNGLQPPPANPTEVQPHRSRLWASAFGDVLLVRWIRCSHAGHILEHPAVNPGLGCFQASKAPVRRTRRSVTNFSDPCSQGHRLDQTSAIVSLSRCFT